MKIRKAKKKFKKRRLIVGKVETKKYYRLSGKLENVNFKEKPIKLPLLSLNTHQSVLLNFDKIFNDVLERESKLDSLQKQAHNIVFINGYQIIGRKILGWHC